MPTLAPSRPAVRHNQTLGFDALLEEAQAAFEASGLTQSEVARRVGRHRSSILRALQEPGSTYAAVQRDIIRALTDYEVSEEPEFRVTRKA